MELNIFNLVSTKSVDAYYDTNTKLNRINAWLMAKLQARN